MFASLRSPIGAAVEFDGAAHFAAARLRMLDRVSQLALVAAAQAIADAKSRLRDREPRTLRCQPRDRHGRRRVDRRGLPHHLRRTIRPREAVHRIELDDERSRVLDRDRYAIERTESDLFDRVLLLGGCARRGGPPDSQRRRRRHGRRRCRGAADFRCAASMGSDAHDCIAGPDRPFGLLPPVFPKPHRSRARRRRSVRRARGVGTCRGARRAHSCGIDRLRLGNGRRIILRGRPLPARRLRCAWR